MTDEEFTERFNNYFERNKSALQCLIIDKKSSLQLSFNSCVKEKTNLFSKILIPSFLVVGFASAIFPEGEKIILRIIVVLIGLGLMYWFWRSIDDAFETAQEYIFKKYIEQGIYESYVQKEPDYEENKIFYDRCVTELIWFHTIGKF